MKNEVRKKQLKEHEAVLKEYIKSWDGIISEIKYPVDIKLPSDISKIDSEATFSRLFEKYHEAMRKKAVTNIKKCKTDLGRQAVIYQYEYFKNNPGAKHKVVGFSHKEVCGIYESALNDI